MPPQPQFQPLPNEQAPTPTPITGPMPPTNPTPLTSIPVQSVQQPQSIPIQVVSAETPVVPQQQSSAPIPAQTITPPPTATVPQPQQPEYFTPVEAQTQPGWTNQSAVQTANDHIVPEASPTEHALSEKTSVFRKLKSKRNIIMVMVIIGILLIATIAWTSLSKKSSKTGSQTTNSVLTSGEYTNPTSGYKITGPVGWTQQTTNSQVTFSSQDKRATLKVFNLNIGNNTLKQYNDIWIKQKPQGYKVAESLPISVNGQPAYQVSGSWIDSSGPMQDYTLLQIHNNVAYAVEGSAKATDWAKYSDVIKKSALSFKP